MESWWDPEYQDAEELENAVKCAAVADIMKVYGIGALMVGETLHSIRLTSRDNTVTALTMVTFWNRWLLTCV